MERIINISNSTILKFIPIVFCSNGYISCILLLFDLNYFTENENIRIIISAIFSVIIWSILFLNILFNIKKYSKIEIILITFIVLICIYPFIFNFFRYGLNNSSILSFGRFAIFSISYVFAAVIIVKKEYYSKFAKYFKWYGIGLIPFVIFYILRMFKSFDMVNEGINLYGFSYMSVANTLFPIMLGCLIDLIVNKNQKYRYLNWIVIVVLWIGIVYSGTRGTILSICWALLISLFMFVRWKNKYEANKTVIKNIIITISLLVFSVFCWAPQSSAFGDNGRLSNTVISNEFSRVENENLNEIFIEKIVNSSDKVNTTINKVKKEMINGNLSDERERNGFTIKDVRDYEFSTGRVTLYRCAFEEMKNKPLLGNGPFYFENKYGTYPHNWILEMLCDFGCVMTVGIISSILWLLVAVLKISHCKIEIMGIVFLCIAYVPLYMLSGSIYLNGTLLFSIIFAVMYIIKNKQTKYELSKIIEEKIKN